MAKKKKRSRKKPRITMRLLLVLTVLSVLLFLSVWLLSISHNDNIIHHSTVVTAVEVGDHVGFNLGDEKLNFGTILGSGNAERSMAITSEEHGYVFLSTYPPFSDWLSVKALGDLYVDKDNPLYMTFRVDIPRGVEPGIYESELNIYVLRDPPNFWQRIFMKGKNVKPFDGSAPSKPSIQINISEN